MTPDISLAELKKRREAAVPATILEPDDFIDSGWDKDWAIFIAYAANHAVEIAERERALADRLAEALKEADKALLNAISGFYHLPPEHGILRKMAGERIEELRAVREVLLPAIALHDESRKPK